ncbi:MAG: hypothetical protein J6S78_01340, partial [Lachnospiraceae bacterium]|nr:hypothetical protein [Lachnospiraceae bacterium]
MKDKRRVRWKAAIVLLVLCAFFMSFSAHAEDIEGEFSFLTSGLEREKEPKVGTFYYRDSYFERSAYELNMDLARLSIRVAFAGFGIGETSEPKHLLPLFDKLGVKYSEETVHYGPPTADTIGFAYGTREISENESLVVVVIR